MQRHPANGGALRASAGETTLSPRVYTYHLAQKEMATRRQTDMTLHESWFRDERGPYTVLAFCWVARLMNESGKRIAEIGSTMDVFADPALALQDYQRVVDIDPERLSQMDFILQLWICSTYFEPHIHELQEQGQATGRFHQKRFIREVNMGHADTKNQQLPRGE